MKKLIIILISTIFILPLCAQKSLVDKCNEYLKEDGFDRKEIFSNDYFRLGEKKHLEKKYAIAEDLYRCTIKSDGNHSYAHYYLAMALAQKGGEKKVSDVITSLKKSIELDGSFKNRIAGEPDFDVLKKNKQFIDFYKEIGGDVALLKVVEEKKVEEGDVGDEDPKKRVEEIKKLIVGKWNCVGVKGSCKECNIKFMLLANDRSGVFNMKEATVYKNSNYNYTIGHSWFDKKIIKFTITDDNEPNFGIPFEIIEIKNNSLKLKEAGGECIWDYPLNCVSYKIPG